MHFSLLYWVNTIAERAAEIVRRTGRDCYETKTKTEDTRVLSPLRVAAAIAAWYSHTHLVAHHHHTHTHIRMSHLTRAYTSIHTFSDKPNGVPHAQSPTVTHALTHSRNHTTVESHPHKNDCRKYIGIRAILSVSFLNSLLFRCALFSPPHLLTGVLRFSPFSLGIRPTSRPTQLYSGEWRLLPLGRRDSETNFRCIIVRTITWLLWRGERALCYSPSGSRRRMCITATLCCEGWKSQKPKYCCDYYIGIWTLYI